VVCAVVCHSHTIGPMVPKFNFNHASTTQYGLVLKGILAGSEV
jgi:hypothetical protein